MIQSPAWALESRRRLRDRHRIGRAIIWVLPAGMERRGSHGNGRTDALVGVGMAIVLAVAVTFIEVPLIVSVMIAVVADKAGLARDTVFAAVMIVCNGIVGLCLLLGGVRHRVQGFQVEGASAALALLAALTVLTLIVPNVPTSAPGPVFNTAQLVFAGTVSLVI
jgi:Ca2+/H+ antiporter